MKLSIAQLLAYGRECRDPAAHFPDPRLRHFSEPPGGHPLAGFAPFRAAGACAAGRRKEAGVSHRDIRFPKNKTAEIVAGPMFRT
ncbi:hypothetical protein [Streptomyces sp. CS113]|uniref:hypothetical protein n=1 Tax=Streptomyces sp. CS113 TaxID=1982761 RepID=UPI00117E6213|nr:hypothetical protein [Streptomyces sp. CS113]